MKKILLAIGLLFFGCHIATAGMSGSIGPKEYRFKKNLGSSVNKVGTQRRYPNCTFLAQYDDDTLTADGSIGSSTATFAAIRASASPATVFNALGVMQKTTTSNVGRFNHGYYDTTGFHLFTHAGYYPESASTNYLTYGIFSAGTTQATGWTEEATAAVTPTLVDVSSTFNVGTTVNAQRWQVVSTGVQYAQIVQTTAADSFVQNDAFTLSVWVKGTTNATNGLIIRVAEMDAAVAGTNHSLADFSGSLSTTEWRKFTLSSTCADAGTDRLQAKILVLSQIDNEQTADIQVTCAQLEKLPHATSFIPTTTAALTRNAETLKYETLGNRTAAVESCVVKLAPEYASNIISATGKITETDTKRRTSQFTATSNDVSIFSNVEDSATSTVSDLINASWTANTEMTLGYAIQHSSPYIAGYYNGVADGTNETANDFTDPAWGTYWHLGNSKDDDAQLNGTIFSIADFSRVLSSTEFADLHNPDINWKRSGFFN